MLQVLQMKRSYLITNVKIETGSGLHFIESYSVTNIISITIVLNLY